MRKGYLSWEVRKGPECPRPGNWMCEQPQLERRGEVSRERRRLDGGTWKCGGKAGISRSTHSEKPENKEMTSATCLSRNARKHEQPSTKMAKDENEVGAMSD